MPRPGGVAQIGKASRPEPPKRAIRERRYAIRDTAGSVVAIHVRREYGPKDKTFVWEQVDGRSGLGGIPCAELPHYGTDEIDDATGIIIVEGEKARDALQPIARELGLAVVGTVTGAPHCPSAAVLGALPKVPLYTWPDSDDPGKDQADAIDAALVALGRPRSGRIAWSGARPGAGDDAANWVAQGGDAHQLKALLDDASVTNVTEFQGESENQGNAPDVAGVTDVTLLRGEEGSAVLDDVEEFLKTYIAYPSEDARVAHALWIAHAHAMDAFESTPRLAFLSPEPASGKTRGLEVTELLVPRPIEAINVTPAYLFRKVDDPDGPPTILFDEIDTVFGPKAREHEEVRGLLNAGHRRGAVAGRCVVKGKSVETVEYPAYCAVAMAGLGHLPDTILTRSVVLRMRRRAPHETVKPFRRRVALPAGHALRDRLATWAASVEDRIVDAWPEMPLGVEDRHADVWEALLAVADAAGGEWPERARKAAVALVAESKESTPSLGIRLLADLRTVFKDRDAMHTNDILAALHALDESPWAELFAGKPLNTRGLSKRLSEYGIKSKPVRLGEKVERGYSREDLADAWGRYLPPPKVAPDDPGYSDDSESSSSRESVTSVTPIADANEDDLFRSSGVVGKADRTAVSAPPAGQSSQRRCVDCGAILPDDRPGFYCADHGRETRRDQAADHLGSPPPLALDPFDLPDPWDEPHDSDEREDDDPWDSISEGVL
jgi:hypothetical protein